MAIRRVSIKKNALLDVVLDEIRSGTIKIGVDENWEDVKTQCTSMKRINQLTDDGVQYVWRKPTDGDDHFHMALGYTYLAAQLRGAVSRGSGLVPSSQVSKSRDPVKTLGQSSVVVDSEQPIAVESTPSEYQPPLRLRNRQ